jgi:hypothetical protein
MKQTNHWVNNPTKKQVTVFLLIGLTAFIFLLLAMTNFFTETPFQGKFLGLYFLLIGAGIAVYNVCRNYYKNNSKKQNEID